MGYSRNAVQGMAWNGFFKVVSTAVVFGKIYILARLLSPADFGLFSLVAIALGIMEAVTETGINTTILQSHKSVAYFLDTAWVIAILRGLLISIFMIVLGIFLQRFYNEPRLLMLVGVASFVPIIKGFINPAIVSLYKDLNFRADTIYRISLLLVETAAGVVLALLTRSAFAFVFAMIISAVFEVGISFFFFVERPRFVYLKSRAQDILHNAKGLNASALLSYAVQNVDNLIIGKVVGTTGLGIYANGFSFSNRLTQELAKSVQHGALPVYVRFHEDKKRLRKAFLKTAVLTMVGLTILSLPFLVKPDLLLLLLSKDKWSAVVQILPWLLVANLMQSFVSLASPVFISTKKYHWLNWNLLLNVVLMFVFITYFGIQYGLVGGAIGLVLARTLALPIVLFGLWQSLKTPSA